MRTMDEELEELEPIVKNASRRLYNEVDDICKDFAEQYSLLDDYKKALGKEMIDFIKFTKKGK